jgi:hypothetical protein
VTRASRDDLDAFLAAAKACFPEEEVWRPLAADGAIDDIPAEVLGALREALGRGAGDERLREVLRGQLTSLLALDDKAEARDGADPLAPLRAARAAMAERGAAMKELIVTQKEKNEAARAQAKADGEVRRSELAARNQARDAAKASREAAAVARDAQRAEEKAARETARKEREAASAAAKAERDRVRAEREASKDKGKS